MVTTDYYDNAEFVRDGVTGFVISHSKRLPAWEQTNAVDVLRYVGEADGRVVADLVAKTSLMIESPTLRARLGRAARAEAIAGRLSLEVKNRDLKVIFDRGVEAGADESSLGR